MPDDAHAFPSGTAGPALPLTAVGAQPLSPRAKRVLAVALGASLILHLTLTLWPVAPDAADDATPLKATLTELPPPPVPVAAPPTPAPKPRPPRRSVPVASAPGPVALPAPEPEPPAPVGEPARAEAPPVAAPVPETVAAAEPVPEAVANPKTLPPRVDLAYKVFWGTQGFEIGEAVYRFEHKDQRYRITTLGQARGLAALVLRGQGKLESMGRMTPEGLQPDVLRIERGGPDRVETALFDRGTRTVRLNDGSIEPLDEPTFDPLSLMWQYYFTPPASDVSTVTVAVATPRRLMRYTITREATETIDWPHGKLEAERWHRRSLDGKTDAYVWVAASLRYIPVKIRVTNTERGTVEVLLDAIRVDDDPASVGRDALTMPSPVERPDNAPPASPLAAPRPAETFPTMTGQ